MKKTLLTLLFSLFLQLGFAQLPKISFHSCENANLAPGKNIELKVTLINDGEVATENDTHVTLKCDSKYITIVNAEAICKPLALNETQEVVFTITANELLPHDSDISFSIESVLEDSSIESYLYYDFEDGIQGWTTIDADGVHYVAPQGTPEEMAALQTSVEHLGKMRDEIIALGILPPVSEWSSLNPNIK